MRWMSDSGPLPNALMRMRPLPAALALSSMAVGAAVLAVVGAFVAIPLLLGAA